MTLNKVEGHADLYSAIALSKSQMEVVNAIISFHGGKKVLRRKEVLEANRALGKKWSPYWIVKNIQCQTTERGIYNLGVLKLKSEKAAKKVAAPVDTQSAKKIAAPKSAKKTKSLPAPAVETSKEVAVAA
jgi:hypothetical protein